MSLGPFPIWTRLLGALVLVVGLVVMGGCDTVPGRDGEQRRPTVSGLQVVTDSIQVSVEDSLAQVDVLVAARAVDADGTIDRVVFTIEPASNPRGTASGELSVVDEPLYGGRIRFTVPLAKEIYTVRVFAVDNDDLASNQVVGQFEFDPEAHTSGSTASHAATLSSISTVHLP